MSLLLNPQYWGDCKPKRELIKVAMRIGLWIHLGNVDGLLEDICTTKTLKLSEII